MACGCENRLHTANGGGEVQYAGKVILYSSSSLFGRGCAGSAEYIQIEPRKHALFIDDC